MATKFKTGNIVSYVFGDTPQYKVVATKEQPKTRGNMPSMEVPKGYEYLIVKTPLKEGEFGAFVSVSGADLHLISEK